MPAAGDDARRSVIGGDAAEPAQPGVFAPNAFVQIDRAGKVTLVMPKVEMGQGVYTALPMLIAEELEVPLSSVTLDHAPPNEKLFLDPLLGGQLTGGSTSVRYAWSRCGVPAPPRARCWSRPPRSNGTSIRQPAAPRGEVLHPPSGRRASYGQLADAAAKLPVPKDVALKQPADFKLIGTPAKRSIRRRRSTAPRSSADVRLPGMLVAVIVNSPVFGTVASVDDTAAKKIPGVRQVVRVDNAVAVVGDHGPRSAAHRRSS